MRYITPRKAASGLGASHTGTEHHWFMTVSAVALAILTPAFLLVAGRAIALPRPEVLLYFSKPYPAIVTGLFLAVGMIHFMRGTRIMIDDYFRGTARKVGLIVADIFGWALIACGLFALARMSLATVLV
ncbi:MAG: succinate dehydrogenase, hydrophobic membrane anchor protein [Paracoccus sp. (in: a-proteobacteria)]|uniref:succinate dehydrogenase, hydrophobic membrane anchor protein n=1 Tax=Paracoccus sp. TaxID=267 RepID=UPI0026DEA4E8|nr:succinate dehydrogenase, hydrophobic membrane anchor protein [Paracoccus sp. (in: a-proteobacteria)]MDO5621526.1 succinate dehydrogenase, hydrophobic membrane anchor protein [Paracoccus sp. (in: a-proteobacteria)]